MPLVVLSFKITDQVTGQFSKRHQTTAARETLRFSGNDWLENIMPLHFHGASQGRYRLEPRTPLYVNVIKRRQGEGEGRFAFLQKTGRSFRFARFYSRVTATATRCIVRMNVPSYFANPKVGTVYEDGKRKEIRRQPNMASELTDTIRRDEVQLDQRATEHYATYFTTRAPRTTRTTTIV